MKYIDADRLKTEIERQITESKNRQANLEAIGQENADVVESPIRAILKSLLTLIDSLQQSAIEEEEKRRKEYRELHISYWRYVNNTIDKKRVLPTFKGQLLHDFKNELHTMKQIVDLINHPEISEGLFDKLALVFATWGGYHFHPNNPLIEDSLQQEQPDTDGLCLELADFLTKNDVPEEKAKFLANRIADRYGSKKYLEGLCDGIKQEQPEVDLEEEINIYLRTFSSSFENGIEYTKNIARYFYELGFNARK